MQPRHERLLLGLLLLAYLIVGSLFAILTPDWQVPDEPAHYNYARQIAERRRCCPVIEPGDWDQAYLSQLTSERFRLDLLDRLDTVQYEDHQPPLYYQMSSMIYRWLSSSLIVMRLFSVLLGTGVVWCTYALSKALLPDRPGVAFGAAAFVAFLPQHVAILAGVNNDSLVELLIGLTLLMTARFVLGQLEQNRRLGMILLIITLPALSILLAGSRVAVTVGIVFLALVAVGALTPALVNNGDWQIWTIGILAGLIFATKATGYFVAGLIPLAIVLRYRRPVNAPRIVRRAYVRTLTRRLAYFLIPALVLGGIWWLRNFYIYGFPDFAGLGAHNRVVVDQVRTAARIAEIGAGPYLAEAVRTTFNSFWGQFGWMALPLQDWMYAIFLALMLIVGVGLLVDRLVLKPLSVAPELARRKRLVWLILWLAIGLTLLMYVYYNAEFLQLQGRYLFPALIPTGLLLAVGLDAWRRWLLPEVAWAQWLPLLVFGLLAPLDVYLILRVIRPLLLP
jgi:hypothetical protein